jgi:hypothetical protein
VLVSVVAALLSMYPLKNLVFGAAFTLRPLCVARGLGWCDHDYPGGTGTIARTIAWNYSSARHTGFSHRVGVSSRSGSGPSLFCPAPISHAATKTTRAGVSFGVYRSLTLGGAKWPTRSRAE